MFKKVLQWFKDMFSNDVGQYDPKAEEYGFKLLLGVILGIFLSITVPILFVYLEAWEITIRIVDLIWHEDFFWRTGYYIAFVAANFGLLAVAGFSTYRINGQYDRLLLKKGVRIVAIIFYLIAIAMYIYCIVSK